MNRQTNEINELFDVKNFYYIGNYQHCINEAGKIKQNSEEKDHYVYRAYIAQQKFRVVLDEIKSTNTTNLIALRHLAEYYSNPEKRTAILQIFDEKVAESYGNLDDIWILSAATFYYNEGMYEAVLKILHGADNLECMALTIQCLLKINRLDLAKKVYVQMQEKDDDATLTQLALAWINIEIGGEKLQDAYYIFQEFCDKFAPTPMLLNGQAVCFIGQQKYEEADTVLRENLEKDHNNKNTLINLIVLSQQLDKNSEMGKRYLSQLNDSHSGTNLIKEFERKDSDFVKLSLQYKSSK